MRPTQLITYLLTYLRYVVYVEDYVGLWLNLKCDGDV